MKSGRNQAGKFTEGNSIGAETNFRNKPENRHNGAWKKEDSVRHKLEKLAVFTETELMELEADTAQPLLERKLAKELLKADWKAIESMVNQIYGTPKQSVSSEITTANTPVALVQFM